MKIQWCHALSFCLIFSGISYAQPKFIDAANVEQQCLVNDWTKAKLVSLKAHKFVVENSESRDALAIQLLSCLASPDPVLRDDIAFSGLSHWFRGEELSLHTTKQAFERLINVIQSDVDDEHGVYQAFAALVLSEVVRVDRVKPYLTDKQRLHVVNVTNQFFSSIKDYRGYDEKLGWRHQVAHSADVLLQLSLNKHINKSQLDSMLNTLAKQVNADGRHFYTYGEPKRIAMPVIYIMLRNEHTIDQWQTWLDNLTSPAPFPSWGDMYQSQQGLVKLHNTRAFLYAVYALIKSSKNERLVAMVPALEAAMKKVN